MRSKEYTLVTGGTGFVGQALIPRLLARGKNVIVLSHKKTTLPEGALSVPGDILESNLGIETEIPPLSQVVHLAATHRLGEDKDGSIWNTNVHGTKNVVNFCARRGIPKLYFVSTAYTQGRNPYERSKALCETMLAESDIPHVTIFKPSIVMGTEHLFYPGHFSQFVGLLIKLHQRADTVRRKIEGTLRLPVLEPVFRLKANPKGKLNLVPVDSIVEAMAAIDKPGTYWLTHPNPPTVQELVDWVSEFIMVRIKIESDFEPNPIELAFEKTASAFIPYLWGDDFNSNIPNCPPITKEFIHATLKRLLC